MRRPLRPLDISVDETGSLNLVKKPGSMTVEAEKKRKNQIADKKI